jgi:tRNA threonylcarbamoyladenosine biosynthesis protein TsaB
MTVTLCIETSGPHCSLVLATEAQNYVQERILNRSHNEHLLAMLDTLFQQAGLVPTDVELVGFGCGPGSFTGVRIAAAAAQAVAFAADAMVVPVASSHVLALSAAKTMSVAKVWLCCLPSRGETYYLSAYLSAYLAQAGAPSMGGEVLEVIQADELVEAPPDWLNGRLKDVAGVDGRGLAVVGALPPWLPADLGSEFVADIQPSAAAIAGYVQQQHTEGKSLPPERALPMYVASDSPWRKSSSRN